MASKKAPRPDDYNDPSFHNDFVVQAGGESTGRWFWKTVDVEELLKAHPEAVKWTDWEGRTALLSAATAGNVENVRLLLKAGADPAAEDREGRTALALAVLHAQEKTIALIDLLADHGADINATDKRGRTPLLLALEGKRSFRPEQERVEKLLQRGADPDHADVDGQSALGLLQERYETKLKSAKSPFAAVSDIAPMLDVLKYWSEIRKLSHDIKPQTEPEAPQP